MKNNKSILIVLLVAIIAVIGILIVESFNNDKSYYQEISYKKFNELLESKETFGLVIKQDGCSFCELYEPKIERIVNEYKIANIYYLNVTKLSSDESKEFKTKVSYSGTPNTNFFKDGVEMDLWTRIEGNETATKIKEKLTNLGYIK